MDNEAKPEFDIEDGIDNRPGFGLTWEGEGPVDVLLLAAHSLEDHDLPKAIEFVEAAIQLDPLWSHSYFIAGKISLRHQKIPEVISWFEKCLELDSNEGMVYDNLSKAHYAAKDLDKALLFVGKFLELQPKNMGGCLRKLRWLAESSRWKELEEFFQANHSTLKETGEARLWHCLAVARLDRLDEARQLFEEATLRSKRQNPTITRQIASIISHSYRKW